MAENGMECTLLIEKSYESYFFTNKENIQFIYIILVFKQIYSVLVCRNFLFRHFGLFPCERTHFVTLYSLLPLELKVVNVPFYTL